MSDLNTFKLKIGNLIAEVQSNHNYVEMICEPYSTHENPNGSFFIDDASVNNERDALLAIKEKHELLPADTADWFLEVYALLHMLLPVLPKHNMLFMHGSAIQYKGKAYIFVAPSGTGKSTHTRLWRERFGDEVTVINDDKPFIAFRDSKVYVCGTPWRGKHNIGENLEAELGGICILSRGETNEIQLIEPMDAVQEIIQQSNLRAYKDNSLLALELIDKLLKSVPVYRLSCTPTLEAVDVCYNGIIK